MDADILMALYAARKSPDPVARPVPRQSGEAAIYSVEYLKRTQGPREGADPNLWRSISQYDI
jgi:hypothetical protein